MLGKRILLVVVCVVAALAAGSAAGGASVRAATADCSPATAAQLVAEHQLNDFAVADPVVQVLCGPFTGPGSQAMAVTIGAATCWSIQRWVVFDFAGGTWRLVLDERAFVVPPLVAVGGDIKETTPVFRSTDPRCVPSGGTRSRIWHWDGARFTAGPWKQAKPAAARTSATFYSPSRNVSCEMNDGRAQVGSFVYCQSRAHPHSVKMGLDGRLKICRGGTATTNRCLGDPGEHTPVLGYGKHITLRHFRCQSGKAGVTCTVIKTGKGFRIDRAGVKRIGS
ncbi:MAG TPA: hypothetical protein VH834_21740 [Solirubrobacteraceae bacterium]